MPAARDRGAHLRPPVGCMCVQRAHSKFASRSTIIPTFIAIPCDAFMTHTTAKTDNASSTARARTFVIEGVGFYCSAVLSRQCYVLIRNVNTCGVRGEPPSQWGRTMMIRYMMSLSALTPRGGCVEPKNITEKTVVVFITATLCRAFPEKFKCARSAAAADSIVIASGSVIIVWLIQQHRACVCKILAEHRRVMIRCTFVGVCTYDYPHAERNINVQV